MRAPDLNALLNALSAALLILGHRFIRRRRVAAHRACMLLALLASAVFLVSYLLYHARVGSVPYRGTGAWRTAYLTILITHSALAAAVPVLAAITATRALRGRFDRHVAIARYTLPIWLYVSVTGVVVYLFLYAG